MSEFAGTLTERVTIERPTGTRNAMGLQQTGWERLFRCLAAILPEAPGPQSEAMALSAMPRFKVTIRRRDGVTIDQRVVWKKRLLMVRQILEDPRAKDRLVLRCEEVRQ